MKDKLKKELIEKGKQVLWDCSGDTSALIDCEFPEQMQKAYAMGREDERKKVKKGVIKLRTPHESHLKDEKNRAYHRYGWEHCNDEIVNKLTK
jgi:hypothetical protein